MMGGQRGACSWGEYACATSSDWLAWWSANSNPKNNPMHSSDVIDGVMFFRIALTRRAELTFDVTRMKQARVGMPEVVKREVTRHLVKEGSDLHLLPS
jgi:hypothetical protein